MSLSLSRMLELGKEAILKSSHVSCNLFDLFKLNIRAVSDPDPQDPKIGSFDNFDSWGSKNPGLLAKRPSKRPEKDPKNRFTGPNFENP